MVSTTTLLVMVYFVVEGINDGVVKESVIFLYLLENVSIKREQNQTCLCYVECEKGRMKSNRKK